MDELKTMLRSILISTPFSTTVKELNHDYEELEEIEVPYRKFGYNSLRSLLLDIPDVLTLEGDVVKPVVTHKVAHVNEMVLRQNFTKNKPGAFKNFWARNNNQVPLIDFRDDISLRVLEQNRNLNTENDEIYTGFKNDDLQKNTDLMRQILLQKDTTNNIRSHTRGASTETSKISTKIRKNLEELISKFPEGIWSWSLSTEYKKLFKRDLDYESLGYRRLINLCEDLPDIFQYQESKGHFKLFDAKIPIPKATLEISSECEKVENSDLSKTQIIHKLNWSTCDSVIPEDVFVLGMELPREFLDAEINDIVKIVVAEIYDISKFWIYKDDGKLDNLMDEMQTFYREKDKEYLVPQCLLENGLYCVAIALDEFHRAFIIDNDINEHFVKVFYIDYGTVGIVPKSEIWFLTKQFSVIPAQAIRARLSDLYPPIENMTWSQKATIRFRQLACMKHLDAKIVEKNSIKDIVEIRLENSHTQININSVLENENLALSTHKQRNLKLNDPNCIPKVKFIHLFPTFEEIENGLVPTSGDIDTISELDVDFYYPHYFTKPVQTDKIDKIERRHRKMLKNKEKIIKFFELSEEVGTISDKTFEMSKNVFGDLFHEMERDIRNEIQRDDDEFKNLIDRFIKKSDELVDLRNRRCRLLNNSLLDETKDFKENSYIDEYFNENNLSSDVISPLKRSWRFNSEESRLKIDDPADLSRLESYLSEDTSRTTSPKSPKNTGLLLDLDDINPPTLFPFEGGNLKTQRGSTNLSLLDESPCFSYYETKQEDSTNSDLIQLDVPIDSFKMPVLKPEILAESNIEVLKKEPEKIEGVVRNNQKVYPSTQILEQRPPQVLPGFEAMSRNHPRPPPGFPGFNSNMAMFRPQQFLPNFPQMYEFPPILIINYNPLPIFLPPNMPNDSYKNQM